MAAVEPPAFPLQVLVAEDNPTCGKIFQLLLEKLGISANVVRTGAEAISSFESRCTQCPYDMVILDLCLPDIHGCEAAKCIRAIEAKYAMQKRSVIVAASALPPQQYPPEVQTLFQLVLPKPISIVHLQNILSAAFGAPS